MIAPPPVAADPTLVASGQGDVRSASAVLTAVAAAAIASCFGLAGQAQAAPTYIGLGDSITFGETDLNYVQSYGDRGNVGDFANIIGSRTGTRPNVINLAIDGETASSFMSNAGRTPPVVGRGDSPLLLENLNYTPST